MEIGENKTLEMILEGVESAIDLITDDDSVRDIPVVGTAFKLCRVYDDVRSKILLRKIHRFLFGTGLSTDSAREKMRRKASSSSHDYERVGEALLLTLDRITDTGKAKILARIFLAYLDEAITQEQLRRLSGAIDLAFIDDLERLVSEPPRTVEFSYGGDKETWKEGLLSSGFSSAIAFGIDSTAIRYVTSSLGELFIKVSKYSISQYESS